MRTPLQVLRERSERIRARDKMYERAELLMPNPRRITGITVDEHRLEQAINLDGRER